MRAQRWLTIATLVLTLGYIALTWHRVDLGVAFSTPGGSATGVIGAPWSCWSPGSAWVGSAARPTTPNSLASWLTWQGYLLRFGLDGKQGEFA